MLRLRPPRTSLCVLLALCACPLDTSGGAGEGDTGSGSAIDSLSSTSATPTGGEPTSAAGSETADGNDSLPGDSSAEGSGSTSVDPTTDTNNDPGNPVDCGGAIYACGDGMDNDGDGHVDLNDPECTGPCDDLEDSFATGLPGDNMDCKQDCFFDGNSGQGDDGCIWHLRCDPANPGANIGCEYTGGPQCDNGSPNQTEGCIMFCEQFVPPGCDCFGCCTIQTPDGPLDIFLNSGPDCSLDNIAGCEQCTSQIEECGNPCEPAECEICFGETEPPEGCGENTCTSELPCDQTADCPTDFFCFLGCCYPPPPG